ncbi:hypothetical protein RDI58_026797 [Solanum bulbocastanum]|uniref:Uncharacterized protein n=1 Tax=Solanum bulbocastanum TaxID=147425 RepID=A0AAN8Y1I5_SOLBU
MAINSNLFHGFICILVGIILIGPSDGRLISDFIAEYANLPLIPSYFQIEKEGFIDGVNFASSLSGSLVETNRGHVINLKTHLKSFKKVTKLLNNKVGDKQSKKLISNAVYMFSTGTVDYGEAFRVIDQRISHPLKFGFEVSKKACCGTGPFRGINSCGGKRQV